MTLESLGSFKVSANISEAATSRLSRSRLGQNFERFSLGSEGLVHIPDILFHCSIVLSFSDILSLCRLLVCLI